MRLSLLALLALFPLAASAQSFDPFGATSPFSLSVSPQYPAPYSTATLSMTSGSIDLTGVTVTVTVGAAQLYKGSAKPLAVELGRAGSPVTVRVTAVAAGVSHTQAVTITPQDVVLVAEPVSSAPVLYPGKPLIPLQGNVRVVAVASLRTPAGIAANPAGYSYRWTVDGRQMANLSGIGKTAILVAAPLQYRERTVGVEVVSAETLVGGSSLSLAGHEPSVRIYENDPLLGIRFDKAIAGTYRIAGAEASLYAAPFSFPTTSGAPLVQWFLNGALAQTGNSVTLRPAGEGEGRASLSLVVSGESEAKAAANLSLIFGAATGFNLFGL